MIRSKNCVTESEEYLKFLCDRTFLSLWSYPNVYRDQKDSNNPQGKEICDLLVVFGNDVIIFSDKRCEFPNTGNLNTDWNRWYKKTILKSADQAWGAERWIRTHSDRLFLDRNCLNPPPIDFPSANDLRIHIILVSHEASKRCREEIGGIGSLTLCSSNLQSEIAEPCFVVCDLNPDKTFVHVLDDTTLNILMGSLTTVTDFIAYLNKKEKLFRSGKYVFVNGEENLLGNYLANVNELEEHDFPNLDGYSFFEVLDGIWDDFQRRPERLAQLEADKISYAWDALIERFTHHLVTNTLYFSLDDNPYKIETALRFLSSENRTCRRVYASQLLSLISSGRKDRVNKKFLISTSPNSPSYIFISMAKQEGKTDDEYRLDRQNQLYANCMALKYRYPTAGHIVGIAVGFRYLPGTQSEDLMYLDAREWNDKMQKEASELMSMYDISTDLPEQKYLTISEYPEVK